ncbi:hypothetical protein AO242_21150 [Pseudomonas sp. ICMP 561]|nr:hypothetical protein AO242_21150 [Pseudomonas sp. ICMP 561]
MMIWSIMAELKLLSDMPSDPPRFISVRSTLRAHLTRQLQLMLMRDKLADGAMIDDQISRDFGL